MPHLKLILKDEIVQNWSEFEQQFKAWMRAEAIRVAPERRRGVMREEEKVAAFAKFVFLEGTGLFESLFPKPKNLDTNIYYASLDINDVLKKFGDHCKAIKPVPKAKIWCFYNPTTKSVIDLTDAMEATADQVLGYAQEKRCFKCDHTWKHGHKCGEPIKF